MSALLENYVALLLVIILWVAVWSIADAVGKLYLRAHTDRIEFYTGVAAVVSVTLLLFFPQHLFL